MFKVVVWVNFWLNCGVGEDLCKAIIADIGRTICPDNEEEDITHLIYISSVLKQIVETEIYDYAEKKLTAADKFGVKKSFFVFNSRWFELKSAGNNGHFFMRLKLEKLFCAYCVIKVEKKDHLDRHLSLMHIVSSRIANIVMTKNEAFWEINCNLENDIERLKKILPGILVDRIMSTIEWRRWKTSPRWWTADCGIDAKSSDSDIDSLFGHFIGCIGSDTFREIYIVAE